jgi:hypothetical protein
MSLNDNTIVELKEKVAAKKLELSKRGRFSPITNCSLEFIGTRWNINTLTHESLLNLLVELNSVRLSAKDLKITDYLVSGYKAEDWIKDLKGRLSQLTLSTEKKELKALETKLDTLLSSDKRTELELADIAKLLS